MIEFEITDMTCGHCVATITKAVKDLHPDAVVNIDQQAHRVSIDRTSAEAPSIKHAIEMAGYTPVLVA